MQYAIFEQGFDWVLGWINPIKLLRFKSLHVCGFSIKFKIKPWEFEEINFDFEGKDFLKH